jgi:hypothetical protein
MTVENTEVNPKRIDIAGTANVPSDITFGTSTTSYEVPNSAAPTTCAATSTAGSFL